MQEMIAKIDAFIEEIAAASVWGYVKNVIDKIKELLKYEGEDEAVEFVDIMTK